MVNSGTEANVNLLQILLADSISPVYVDKYAHATFAFGIRASGRSEFITIAHNDADDLLRKVKENGPGIVCIDTLYSAFGTIADIERIVDICCQYDCILIADEAHAIGVLGLEGEGLVQKHGLQDYVPFRTTSLTKSFGGGGGLITFRADTAEGKMIMIHLATMAIFSLAPQEACAIRHIHALDIIRNDDWRRQELREKTAFFQKGMIDRGYHTKTITGAQTCIIPFVVGNIEFAIDVYHTLVRRHVYPSPHVYPASPRNRSVLRFTVCNLLSYEDIQYALDVFEEVYPIIKPWEWPDN